MNGKKGVPHAKKPVKWLGIVLLFCIPLAYFLTSAVRRDRDASQNLNKPHIQIQKKSLQAWESLEFYPLSKDQEIIEYLRSVPVRGDKLLNDAQREALFSTMASMFGAFRDGSFDAYIKFRLPKGAAFVPNESQFKIIRDNWQSSHGVSADMPTSDLDLFRWWVKQQSGGDFYKDFWQQICILPDEIYTKLGTTNEVGVAAKSGIYVSEEVQWDGFGRDAVYCTFHAGLDEYPASFKFAAATSRSDKKLAVSLYFFIKPRSPDPVLPVGVRFFWDQETANWLPINLVLGNLHVRSGKHLVF